MAWTKDEIQISHDYILSFLGCAFHIPSGALILADLHVGYEASLEEEGFAMPRFQTDEMLTRFQQAIDRYDPTILIVNGDLKHNFKKNLRAEWSEVEKIVDFMIRFAKPVILRGNHDNYLATILSRRGLQLKKELILNDIKISHGHETSSSWDSGMILAHEHPAVRLKESTGASVKIPCFLFNSKFNRLIVPAFSPLSPGADILRTANEERMIPLLRKTGIDEYSVYGFTKGGILNYRSVRELRGVGEL